ncbi:MAG TPA: SCO family protein [Burkholderiales bacterium]|nr:SCO family protein [Burkholderiales bacterium]
MAARAVNRIGLAALVCALVLAVGAVGWLLGARSGGGAAPRAPLPVLGQAPSFRDLTDQLGHSIDSSRFRGKVQVVTFLFPYCTTYCPLIAAHLAGLENVLKLAGLQDRVAIIAFNVDPAGTGPQQMRAFLKEYGWDPRDTRWEFLTGRPQAIRRVVTQGYHIAYQKVSDGDDGAQGPELTPQPEVVNALAAQAHVGYDITHNDGLAIVDQQGRIRKFYTQADVVSNEQLFKDIQALLPRGS